MKIKNEKKIKNENEDIKMKCQQQKPPWRFSQAKYHRWYKKKKKRLPLYLILSFIWYRFRYLIKTMTDVGDILNDDEFFGNIADTTKEGIEQHKK